MWPFFNFDNVFEELMGAVKFKEIEKQNKLIKLLIRNQRTSVPNLIKTLECSRFSTEFWMNIDDFACDVLILLANDKRSKSLVIELLLSKYSDPSHDYRVSYILDEIGVKPSK